MSINDATRFDWDSANKTTSVQWPESKISPELLAKYTALADEEQNEVDFNKLHRDEEENLEDVVNNPDHYNTGNVECIEAIEESMSPEAFKGYLKGNAMKYLWRYEYKGKQVEDLQKCQWYLARLTQVVVFENE